jgi:hypothetical protein
MEIETKRRISCFFENRFMSSLPLLFLNWKVFSDSVKIAHLLIEVIGK